MSEETVVFGQHAVRTLLERRAERASLLVLQKGREDARTSELMRLAQAAGVRIEHRDARELDRLTGSERHQGACLQIRASGALGEGALDDVLDKVKDPLLLVLDGVQDPHNLGACLRTADAAGVAAVIVPRDRAAGLSPTVRKVASGAAETLPLIQVVNLARTLRWLKERELWIVGTDDEATSTLYGSKLTGPLAVVLGAEGAGLRRLTRECCDLLIGIPMHGVVESLNVSVATGVVLYEALRQRGTEGQLAN
jgi:23S rRNA (guanosine2251-2'-O)-methyltransferase